MAVTRETLRLVHGLHLAINATLDAADEAILRAWGRAWDELATDWDKAIGDLVSTVDAGKTPTPAQIGRAQRIQNALKVTRESLLDLAHRLSVTVTEQLPAFMQDATAWQEKLIASQFPAQAGTVADIIKTMSRVDADELAAIVRRTTWDVASKAWPLSAAAEAAMRAALIRGVAVGDNPRKVAADMLARVHGAFEGGKARALVISRTEMIDAHRAASALQNQANAKVLTGWEWLSALDRRTCPGCFGMHGTFHRLEESGPDGHQQCRCTRLPATQSWKDLGFNIPEPDSVMPSAQDVFGSMPREDQLAVMGKTRLDLLDSGRISWSDLARQRSNPGWRDSWVPVSLTDLLAKAA